MTIPGIRYVKVFGGWEVDDFPAIGKVSRCNVREHSHVQRRKISDEDREHQTPRL